MSADKKNQRQPLELPKKDSVDDSVEVKKAVPQSKKPPAKPDLIPVKVSDGATTKIGAPTPAKATPPAKAAAKPVKLEPTKAAPAKDTIYIDNDDEITAIIDKVEHSKSELVALVLPKRAQVLQSIVNMRLLKRSADEVSKNLVLVTNEAGVIPLAGAAGVNVAKNLQAKPYIPASPVPVKSAVGVASAAAAITAIAGDEDDEANATLDYHRSMGELAVNEETNEPETIHLAEDAAAAAGGAKVAQSAKKTDKAPKDKRLKVPNFDKFRTLLIVAVIALIALVVFLIAATKFLPKATIDVQTTGTPVSANFTLNTSDKATAVDQTKLIIPATLQSKDQTSSQSVQATGSQNNGKKATGTVKMTAKECDTSFPSNVPAGVTLTANGLTYVTQETTKFSNPGINNAGCFTYQSTGSTSIAATAGGNNFNQPSGTEFKVNSRSDVSVSGSTSGGTDDTVVVVSQADIDKAKAAVTSQSSDAFSKDFQKKLTDQGLYIIAPTLKISEPQVTATPGLGQPASTTNVTVKITYSVLTVKNDDLKAVVAAQLNKQIDTGKQKILDSDILKNVVMTVQNQTGAIAVLNVTADASATPNIDTDAIKKLAAGKKVGDIRDQVSNITGVKGVDVKLSPFWVSKAPGAAKIKVNLKLVQDSQPASTTNAQQP